MTEIFDQKLSMSSYSAYNDANFANLINKNLSTANTNEEFYSKLVELKNEQKKTLEFMQDLYNQKQLLKHEIQKSETNLNDLKTKPRVINTENLKYERNTVSAYENRFDKDDRNRDLNNNNHDSEHQIFSMDNFENENEEYIPKRVNFDCKICTDHDHDYNDSEFKMNNNTNYVVKHDSFVARKPPMPIRHSNENFTTNQENNLNTKLSINSDKLVNDLNANLKKIEKIWDNFNLEDYDYLRNNLANIDERQVNSFKTDEKEWIPRVTLFEPFQMTLRDQAKSKHKLKCEQEIEEERIKKLHAELKECNTKFKATPVPAHVFLPLYEEKKKEEEIRKERIKLMSQYYYENVLKPFSFTERDRRHSLSDIDPNIDEKNDKIFLANPLPDFYFADDNITEKMKEQELYRQIRNQIRAYELLKESKMPKNMELQEEKKRLEIERDEFIKKEINNMKNNNRKSKLKNQSSLRKSLDVPNYDALYKKFTCELEAKKSINQKNTICKPFSFNTTNKLRKVTSASNSRVSSATNPKRSFGKQTNTNDSTRKLNRTLSTSMDSMPIQNTESQRLRESVTKSKLDTMAMDEARKNHIEKMKKIKSKDIYEKMQPKLKNPNPKDVNNNIDRKTRENIIKQRIETEKYETDLEEIKRNAESKKFLFERVEEENARRAAEKRLKENLRKAGLSEDILRNSNDKQNVAKSVKKSYGVYDNWVNE